MFTSIKLILKIVSSNIIFLVPTLQRGNACTDAPASSKIYSNYSVQEKKHLTLERLHMRYHAGAWERGCVTSIILLIIAIVVSNNAKADSWTVTQTTTITMNQLSLSQNATNTSTQAVNHINLNMTNGEIQGTQTFNGGGKNATFIQNNTQNSKQAINRISANHVSSATQTVSGIATLNFELSGSTGNIQAGNLIETNSFTANAISQSLSVDTINFKVDGGEAQDLTDNIQAANVIITSSGSNNDVTQTTTATTVTPSSSISSLNFFKIKTP
jgi:hypothetical protein